MSIIAVVVFETHNEADPPVEAGFGIADLKALAVMRPFGSRFEAVLLRQPAPLRQAERRAQRLARGA
jgi:hypothetical protein